MSCDDWITLLQLQKKGVQRRTSQILHFYFLLSCYISNKTRMCTEYDDVFGEGRVAKMTILRWMRVAMNE